MTQVGFMKWKGKKTKCGNYRYNVAAPRDISTPTGSDTVARTTAQLHIMRPPRVRETDDEVLHGEDGHADGCSRNVGELGEDGFLPCAWVDAGRGNH